MTTFGIYITVVSFQTINEETAILVSKYCRREHGCVMITARSHFWLVCWEGSQTGTGCNSTVPRAGHLLVVIMN